MAPLTIVQSLVAAVRANARESRAADLPLRNNRPDLRTIGHIGRRSLIGFPNRNACLIRATCYPFYFIGSAPSQLIVRAERVEYV